MKLVLSLSEVAQIVIDHLTETDKLSDDDNMVFVTWSINSDSVRDSKLIIEE